MLPTGIARTIRGLRRLPAPTRRRNPAATRPHEPAVLEPVRPWLLERSAALHGQPVDGSGGGSDGVEDSSSASGGRNQFMGALDLFLLGDPTVPVTVSVPRHQTTTSDGFVISVEATCTAQLFYTVMAADYAQKLMIASAEEAAKAEMVGGGWSYESVCLAPIDQERFAEHVLARLTSSGHNSSSALVFKGYAITSLALDPPATLAVAATQEHEPDSYLMAAVSHELSRQIRMDSHGRVRTTQQRLDEASKAVSRFSLIYNANRPQHRRWILGLFMFIIIFVLVGSSALYGYNTLSAELCAAQLDSNIEACANSFKYHLTGGWLGETLEQRQRRLAAEAERQQQRLAAEAERKQREDRRKKERELERLRREEERLKWIEEQRRSAEECRREVEKHDKWRRDRGMKPSPLGRLAIQFFWQYRRPRK